MKQVLLLLLVSLALAGMVAADGCSIQDLCYNQDNMPFCAPNDASCTYKSYELLDGVCVASLEADGDGDNWSTTCDAFPEDNTEWMDLDADTIGHNTDCDDLNSAIGLCVNIVVRSVSVVEFVDNNTSGSDDSSNSTDGASATGNASVANGSASNGHRRKGNVGIITIVPQKKDNASLIEPLAQEPEAHEELVVLSEDSKEPDFPDESLPLLEDAPRKGNLITGNVLGFVDSPWGLGLLVFILCLLMLFFILRRRQKN